MRTIRTWLLLMVILSAAACKPLDPVEVGQPKDLKLAGLSDQQVNLHLSVPIRNPNFYRIKVTQIRATAYINDSKAGNISNQEIIKLPANSDQVHQLKLMVSFSDLLESGLSAMEIIRKGALDLKLEGNLTVRSFLYKKDVPFTRNKTLKLNN